MAIIQISIRGGYKTDRPATQAGPYVLILRGGYLNTAFTRPRDAGATAGLSKTVYQMS
jgi:hypothetical protein